MEAEAFLLGHWKNYQDLEEDLSMPELLATLEASRKVKWKDYRFQAAMQGITIPEEPGEEGPRTFEQIRRDAAIRAQGGDPDDILGLSGNVAHEEGFGIGIEGGLNYNIV
jgi:hypothetical protein